MFNGQTTSTSLPLRQTKRQHTRFRSTWGEIHSIRQLTDPYNNVYTCPRNQSTRRSKRHRRYLRYRSILGVIQNEIEGREISEKIKAITIITEPKRPQFSKQTTTSSFVVESTPPLPTPACVYCSDMHFSSSCQTITDISAWKTILKRDKRCFTCLKKGHNAEQCDKSCRKCKRRHHKSICPEQTIAP